MVTGSGDSSRRRAAPLRGRSSEVSALGRIVEAVRAGESRVLVIRGEPGVGKSALLDNLATQASGCQVVRVLGVQSEMELAFAGLHQLCAPMLNRLDRLPVPQREALQTAFGLISAAPAADRFLVGLAVLSLLSEVAGERPLMCLVDDQQWLDRASAQALGFAARRLAAEPVGLLFATRDPGDELAGLPELTVEGLWEGDARALLDSVVAGPLDARVRDQIVAETRGNPLALLQLPQLRDRPLSALGGATVDEDMGPRLGELFRHPQSDTFRADGDEDRLAIEFCRAGHRDLPAGADCPLSVANLAKLPKGPRSARVCLALLGRTEGCLVIGQGEPPGVYPVPDAADSTAQY